MKKSQEIKIVSNGEDLPEILNEAEDFSRSINLSEKDALRVRLLAEETMSMIRTLTGEVVLTISFINQDDECIIQVETDTKMNMLKKEDILSLSASGKNISAVGIMGKIRDVFETAFMMPTGAAFSDYCTSNMMMGMPIDTYSGQLMDNVYWTLEDYRNSVEADENPQKHKEYWDELEKSIVSNIADDVQVGVKGNHVIMNIIYKLTGG